MLIDARIVTQSIQYSGFIFIPRTGETYNIITGKQDWIF